MDISKLSKPELQQKCNEYNIKSITMLNKPELIEKIKEYERIQKHPQIFTQRHSVITSFIVPWILGLGCKTPEEAKEYIKYGETLGRSYYPFHLGLIKEEGDLSVYSRFMKRLFNENNIDYELSKMIDDTVYIPWDCLSGIYQLEINEKMGLVARPNGVTKDNECVVMVDDYLTKIYSKTEEELTIKLLATMAVWKAKKGIFIIKKMKKNICIDFDSSKWEDILSKIKVWAEI